MQIQDNTHAKKKIIFKYQIYWQNHFQLTIYRIVFEQSHKGRMTCPLHKSDVYIYIRIYDSSSPSIAL